MSSDGRSFWTVLAAVVGVAGVIAVGILGLRPGTSETQYHPGVTLGDPQDYGSSGSSTALVVGKNQSGGSSLFGLHFGRVTHRISAQFFTSPGCFGLVESGDRWPNSFVECSTDVGVEGTVTGLGRAWTEETIVVVDVEVDQGCFDDVSAGDFWPADVPACLVDE
ncbi:MAG: hypothetical protein GY926_10170 [bacterium]|nr:hypothetical protein [bacterium]